MRVTEEEFAKLRGQKPPQAKAQPEPIGSPIGQMRIVLPYPPTTNHLYVTVIRNGKPLRKLSEEGENYKQTAGLLAKKQGAFVLTGEVVLTFRVYRPRKNRDLTNCFKVAEDSLSGICWIDDKQVVELHAYRFDDPTHPRIEVDIRNR